MKKYLGILIIGTWLSAGVSLAQLPDSTQTTTTEQQGATTGQKLMFYGLTGAGLFLLYLSYRQSKWGRKG